MKTRFTGQLLAALLGVAFTAEIHAQTTAFTYQGQLTDNGSPANGLFDLTFSVWTNSSGPGQVGDTITNLAVPVSNGVFTSTVDFGLGTFTGLELWLEIGVSTNGAGAFSTLSPRQQVTSTPYAITAANLNGLVPSGGLSGTYSEAITFANVANNFTGDGAGLLNVDATTLNGLSKSNFWQLGGNAGTTAGTHFLGTTDNQPLELKVNGQRALRLEPDTNGAPNVIGGSPGNLVGAGVAGATVAGGGSVLPADYTNAVLADYGTVGGGAGNAIGPDATFAAILGGQQNTIQSNSSFSVIAGGYRNQIEAHSLICFIGSGHENNILRDTEAAVIAGGWSNTIEDNTPYAVIGGGESNLILSNAHRSTIAGGAQNSIMEDAVAATIGGGQLNLIYTNANQATIGGGQLNNIAARSVQSTIAGGRENSIRFDSQYSTIGGGLLNRIGTDSWYSTIAGGVFNEIGTNADYSAIGGGDSNEIGLDSWNSTIAGGVFNEIGTNSLNSTIGGGYENRIANLATYATIPGGYRNAATNYAFAAGNRAKAIHTGAFVWADSTEADFASTASNQFLIRATGGVGINTTNPSAMLDVAGTVRAATIELTTSTTISNFNADLLDGQDASTFWRITGNTGTIAGTHFLGTADNQPLEFKVNGQRALRLEPGTNGAPSVIAGSPGNFVGAGVEGATISGGGATNMGGVGVPYMNEVLADYATVGGGLDNRLDVDSMAATIAGGYHNSIGTNADWSVISGGDGNSIEADSWNATISGGWANKIRTNGHYNTIGGGGNNNTRADCWQATIAGGYGNEIGTNSLSSTIGGGYANDIGHDSYEGTVAGGYDNDIGTNTYYGTIGGGSQNEIGHNAWYGTIPGGSRNTATNSAFAAGNRAKAIHTGAFVWADSTEADFPSTAPNQFLVRATGGVGINTTNPTATLDVAGTVRAATIELTTSTTISNFNADLLDGLEGSAFWSITGNTGTIAGTHFLGTADNQPLELKANRQRVLRLEPDTNGAPNVVGGAPLNVVDPGIMGATIGGGGATNSFSPYLPGGQLPGINRISAHFGTVAGGGENTIERDALGAAVGGGLYNQTASNAVVATISGGALNVIGTNANGGSIGGGYLNSIDMNASQATISGGSNNVVGSLARWATIGGGIVNRIQQDAAGGTVAGGSQNTIGTGASASTIAGGAGNTLSQNSRYGSLGGGTLNLIRSNVDYATIPGGYNNEVGGDYGFAAGRRAKANHDGTFVWADSQNADFTSTTSNQFCVRAEGGVSIVAGSIGLDGAACRIESTAGNGVGLWVTQTSSDAAAVLANGGVGDLLKAYSPSLVFRLDNVGNVTANSFGGSGSGLTSLNASQLTSGTVNDARLSANVARLNSSPTFSGTVTAGGDLQGNRLVVGASHDVTGTYASVAGGSNNDNHGSRSSIGGGQSNAISAGSDHTAISGGQGNTASTDWVAISGGQSNNASGNWAAVGGGFDCQANNAAATVGGGYNNTASGNSATIPGGADNTASGNYSFAAGRFAQATHTASLVFSGGETTASWGDRTFTARAHGGVRFYSATGTGTGVQLAAGGNSWSAVSDRTVKENFTEVDPCQVLERVAALPVTTWNLKSQPKGIRHIGPMAQDFGAAFGVGEDDRYISSSDADGVALAAIQGLNRKLEDTVAELRLKDSRISALEAELSALKESVMKHTTGEGQP